MDRHRRPSLIVVVRQHLGQGHDQDHPDPARRRRLVCGGRHLRSAGRPRQVSSPGRLRDAAVVRVCPFTMVQTVFCLFTSGNVDGAQAAGQPSIAIMMPARRWPPWSSTSATCARSPPPSATATTSPIPACTAPCWATVLRHHAGRPVRRARQHDLRREHRRSGAEPSVYDPARHPHRGSSGPCIFSFSPKFAARHLLHARRRPSAASVHRCSTA